jgi:transcriptional antiterminator RfaH
MNKFRVGWYLVYTKPRHEKKVHTRLTQIEIKSFLPTKKILRTWHDRKKYIDEPLFPSYVFVYLNDMKNYYDGINTDGVLYYVRTGKEVARICETVVNNIKLATEHLKDIEISDNCFQPGRRLVVSQGALTGLSCEVIRYNSKQKLLVRVDLLQRNVLLTLPEEYLMSI